MSAYMFVSLTYPVGTLHRPSATCRDGVAPQFWVLTAQRLALRAALVRKAGLTNRVARRIASTRIAIVSKPTRIEHRLVALFAE
jgi:hypothetical protein